MKARAARLPKRLRITLSGSTEVKVQMSCMGACGVQWPFRRTLVALLVTDQTMRSVDVLVAGGGLAGLAATLGLRSRGIDAHVFGEYGCGVSVALCF
jgi:hypothetical protein